MSYFKCPDCGKEHEIFGPSHADEIESDFGIPVLARVPIDPSVAELSDKGKFEDVDASGWIKETVDALKGMITE